MDSKTILITMPLKRNDPTEFTYQWATNVVNMAKDFGYKVITIQKDDTTYQNINKTIQKYKPRIVGHFGHGCPSSLQGNRECIITRKFTPGELLCMAQNPYEKEKVLRILNPLGELSCPGICTLDNDPCYPICTYPTNVQVLKDTITIAVACHSAYQLGKCAINYGAETYIGYNDLLMFPVDTLNSQDIFGEIQMSIFRELLMGKTVKEAEEATNTMEDYYIRNYKKIKYISLPMLWNKLNRKILGNSNAMIYEK